MALKWFRQSSNGFFNSKQKEETANGAQAPVDTGAIRHPIIDAHEKLKDRHLIISTTARKILEGNMLFLLDNTTHVIRSFHDDIEALNQDIDKAIKTFSEKYQEFFLQYHIEDNWEETPYPITLPMAKDYFSVIVEATKDTPYSDPLPHIITEINRSLYRTRFEEEKEEVERDLQSTPPTM